MKELLNMLCIARRRSPSITAHHLSAYARLIRAYQLDACGGMERARIRSCSSVHVKMKVGMGRISRRDLKLPHTSCSGLGKSHCLACPPLPAAAAHQTPTVPTPMPHAQAPQTQAPSVSMIDAAPLLTLGPISSDRQEGRPVSHLERPSTPPVYFPLPSCRQPPLLRSSGQELAEIAGAAASVADVKAYTHTGR